MSGVLAQALLRALSAHSSAKRYWVAYSGGLDSQALLHACAHSLPLHQLNAVHIHHGLNKQAEQWVAHCQQQCAALNIPLSVHRVKLPAQPEQGIEAAAREARYAVFRSLLRAGDLLLTAQHADDQAETLLLQLLRGAGPAGLAAMPEQSQLGAGVLLRPWLSCSQAQLQAYAQQQGLSWVEDSSNADTRFDRNYLRHQVMPHIAERWPSYVRTFGRAAAHQAETLEILAELAAEDLQRCINTKQGSLQLAPLLQLSRARQVQLLRYWLQNQEFAAPSQIQIQRILAEVIPARADAQPEVCWEDFSVRRYQQQLFAVPTLPPVPAQRIAWTNARADNPPPLPLGRLRIQPQAGQGLVLPERANLSVGFRSQGETWYFHGQHRPLKKCLQEARILPWLRPLLPLIYLDQQLIAVPGVGIDARFRARPEQTGWIIDWQHSN